MAEQSLALETTQAGTGQAAIMPRPGSVRRFLGQIEAVVFFGLLGAGVLMPIVLLLAGLIRG